MRDGSSNLYRLPNMPLTITDRRGNIWTYQFGFMYAFASGWAVRHIQDISQ